MHVDISFVPHAVDSMAFWHVSEERVRRALLAPDRIIQGDKPERLVALSWLANEALPLYVVYTSPTEDTYIVITVFRGREKRGR
jgi:hypothetical protein